MEAGLEACLQQQRKRFVMEPEYFRLRLTHVFSPTALRMTKTQWSFGHFECSRVTSRRSYSKSQNG